MVLRRIFRIWFVPRGCTGSEQVQKENTGLCEKLRLCMFVKRFLKKYLSSSKFIILGLTHNCAA